MSFGTFFPQHDTLGHYWPDGRRREDMMATEILLPKLGFSMNEGVLAEWLVADGGQVTEGEPLFALESDKSTQEVDAPTSGTLRIIKQPGETYEVGTVLGEIL